MPGALTVYAYGNSDALHGIFNAVAMIMGSDDFGGMVKVCLVIGFLSVAIVAMLPKHLDKTWNWFMAVAVLNGILLVPTTTVVIEDRLGVKPTVAVGNVPWTLGLLASVKSSLGSTLTELFETAFQTIPASDKALPSELAYLRTGVLFGNRMIKGAREATVPTSSGNVDLLNYWRSCVFPDAENIGDAIQRSTNLMDIASNPNPALVVAVHGSDGQLDTFPCDQAWGMVQDKMLNGGGWADEAIKQLAAKSFPDRAINDAITQTESSLVAAWATKSALMPASATAKDVMVQNIMINAAADAAALQTASLNDPALLTLASARAQAVSSMNAGYLTQGRIAEEALPLIRNVVEAIIYAVFPIICLMGFALEGQALRAALKGYLMILLWVELWPAMFAIVNYLQTNASALNLRAAGADANGLSLSTAAAVYGTAVSDLSVASWMVTFVPAIAGAVLFGMHQLVSSIGNARAGAQQSDAAAPGAVKGNLDAGNMSMGQQNVSARATDPFVSERVSIGGSRATNALTGQTIDTYAESRALAEANVTTQLQEQFSQRKADNLTLANSESQAYTKSVDAGWNQLLSLSREGNKGVDRTTLDAIGRVGSEGEAKNDVRSHADNIMKKFGISQDSTVSKELQAAIAASAGVSVEGSTPSLGGILPQAKARASLEGTLRAAGMSKDSEAILRSVDESANDVKTRQTMRKEEVLSNFTHTSGFKTATAHRDAAADNVSSSLTEAQQHREGRDVALRRAQQDEVAQAKVKAFMRSGSARYGNEFANFLRANGESPTDGVGRTGRQVELLEQFIQLGDINGPAGDWVPGHFNGPNWVSEPPSFSREGLREQYGTNSDVPTAADVRNADAGNRNLVTAAQQRAGVSPSLRPSGKDIILGVSSSTGRLSSSIDSADEQLGYDMDFAKTRLGDAKADVSPFHAPLGLFGSGNFITGQTNPVYGQVLSDNATRSLPPAGADRIPQAQRAASGADLIPGATPPKQGGKGN